jgi:uncharacterized delta-60 repeat protein
VVGNMYPDGPEAGDSPGTDIALARYTTAGVLDPSFGHRGKVVTSFGPGDDAVRDVAIQSDGKIVAAGDSGSDFLLIRYSAAGSLDRSFGDGGKVTTRFGPPRSESAEGFALAIQRDGKVVVAGLHDTDVALARYARTGRLDRRFGHEAKVTTDFGTLGDLASDVAIQPDGMIVVSGSTSETDDEDNEIGDVVLARYTTSGSLDPTFGVQERSTSSSPLASATAGIGRGRAAQPVGSGRRTIIYGALVGFPLIVLVSALVLLAFRRRRDSSSNGGSRALEGGDDSQRASKPTSPMSDEPR